MKRKHDYAVRLSCTQREMMELIDTLGEVPAPTGYIDKRTVSRLVAKGIAARTATGIVPTGENKRRPKTERHTKDYALGKEQKAILALVSELGAFTIKGWQEARTVNSLYRRGLIDIVIDPETGRTIGASKLNS
jgi:hypothetical protein